MRKIFTLLVSFVLLTFVGTAQKSMEVSKPIVIKANYFDVSPPLREMAKQQQHVKYDNSWKDGVVKNILYPTSIFPDPTDVQQTDPTSTQTWFGTLATDTLLQSFDGLSSTGAVPPDTDGDVGPNHYFQVVNTSYAIYNKSGNKILGPLANSSIFQGLPNNSNDGDAVVLYDEAANRWLFSQFSLPNYPNGPFYENVAISQTGDPTGAWYRYQFAFNDMPDYPKLSVWVDGYYMTTNRFSSGSVTYAGTGAVAMDRAKMLVGDPTASMITFNLSAGNAAYAVLPADCDGTMPPMGTPCYFAYTKSSYINIYEFHADWANPGNSTYSSVVNLPVNTFNGTLSGIPQPGTSTKLDAIGGRLMFRLPFRTFSDHWSMAACGTVNINGIASKRWYELRKVGSGQWSIYQQATFNPDNNYRWMGSIAMDSSGNIALGYSVSSSSLFPSIRYCGRMANDPLNTLTITEGTIVDGGGSQTGSWSGRSRWGDYSSLNADPAAPNTFWYTQEYYQTTSEGSWKTRIGCFSFGNVFASYATAYPASVCAGDSSQLKSVAYGGSGNYTFSWSSIPAGFSSNLQNPKAAPSENTKFICQVSDGTSTRFDTTFVKVSQPPTCFAGDDIFITTPIPTSIDLQGTATNYRLVGWDSNGDGHFSGGGLSLNTTYTFGATDTIFGNTIELKLVALPNAPCSGNVSSTMNVFFFGVGIKEAGIDHLKVFPNPAHELLHVNFSLLEMQKVQLELITLKGTKVWSNNYAPLKGTFEKQINVASLEKGTYLLKITTDKGTTSSKVVIE